MGDEADDLLKKLLRDRLGRKKMAGCACGVGAKHLTATEELAGSPVTIGYIRTPTGTEPRL